MPTVKSPVFHPDIVCVFQGGLPERDQDYVPVEGREHRACAGSVCAGGATLHDRGVHEVWRPQPVPARPRARVARRRSRQRQDPQVTRRAGKRWILLLPEHTDIYTFMTYKIMTHAHTLANV